MATDPALCATATLATLPLSLTVATSAPSLIVMDVLSQMDDYLFIEDPFKSLFDHLTSVVLSEIRATAPQGHARVYRSHLQQRTLQYAIDTRYAVDQIQALREDCPVSIRIIVLDNKRLELIKHYMQSILQLETMLKATLDLKFYSTIITERPSPSHIHSDKPTELAEIKTWALYQANAEADTEILDLLAHDTRFDPRHPDNGILKDLMRELENQRQTTYTEKILFETAFDTYDICFWLRYSDLDRINAEFKKYLEGLYSVSRIKEILASGDLPILREMSSRVIYHKKMAAWIAEQDRTVQGQEKPVGSQHGVLEHQEGKIEDQEEAVKGHEIIVEIQELFVKTPEDDVESREVAKGQEATIGQKEDRKIITFLASIAEKHEMMVATLEFHKKQIGFCIQHRRDELVAEQMSKDMPYRTKVPYSSWHSPPRGSLPDVSLMERLTLSDCRTESGGMELYCSLNSET